MKQTAKNIQKPGNPPLDVKKLFKRKMILLAIILFLFILLILDKEFGLFQKIFGDRVISFRKFW